MGKSKSIFGFLIIALFCTLVSTQAVEAASEEWEFTLSFFPFLAGIDGEVTVKGSKSSVDVGFSDLLDVLDFGLGAHFEVKKGKFGFFFEPTYMKLSVEEQVDPINAEVEVEMWLVEFAGFYQLGELNFGTNDTRKLSFDVLAGGRYWYLGNEIKISEPTAGTFNAEAVEGWIDPLVGVRFRIDLTEKFLLHLRGDIGGFSIASEFTWNAIAIFGYNISKKTTMWAGYRFLGVDYEEGEGTSLNKFDITMSGPLIGLSYRF